MRASCPGFAHGDNTDAEPSNGRLTEPACCEGALLLEGPVGQRHQTGLAGMPAMRSLAKL
jgi:hypothetical protein